MNLRSMFGNVSIGKDTSGNFKLTRSGVVVRTSGSDYVGYDKDSGSLIDATSDVIGELGYIYKTPTEKLHAGDLLLVKDGPTPDVLFVKEVEEDGIQGLNPRTFRSEKYVPPTWSGKKIYISVSSPLLDSLDKNPLLPLLLTQREGEPETHTLAALLLAQLTEEGELDKLLPVLASEKGLSSELLHLVRLRGALSVKKASALKPPENKEPAGIPSPKEPVGIPSPREPADLSG